MANDLNTMSRKQLEKLAKDVQKALKSIETKEKREAKKAAEKAVAKFGFSLSDVTGAPSAVSTKKKPAAKKPSAPKYANPADSSQTWTGKGRQPVWFREAVEAGTDPASMAI
ncbi:MAG: H-NS family nucleoid-associated regulatory protein [Paracoccaceae bacterium]